MKKEKYIHPALKSDIEQLQSLADELKTLPDEYLIFLKGYASGLNDAAAQHEQQNG